MLATIDNTRFDIAPPRHAAFFTYTMTGALHQCHLIFGHYGNFRTKFNLGIIAFALNFKAKMLAKCV